MSKPAPIVSTAHGSFCAACQSLLSIEEEDFGVCDACDGEGIGGDDDDFEPETPQDHTPAEACQMTPQEQKILDKHDHTTVICIVCCATLGEYRRGEKCSASLAVACPGFMWVENAVRTAVGN